MKKLPLLITLVTLTGMMLSSCSRLENITVTKRQHRSGYYVDLGSRKKETPVRKVAKSNLPEEKPVAVITETSPTVAVTEPTIKQENVSLANSTTESTPAPQSNWAKQALKKKEVHSETTNNIFASRQTTSEIKEIVNSETLKKRTRSFADSIDQLRTNTSEDVPFWLLIVLAIILPPLAVGLKFGISTEFWISILLTLLFWLPGVIYALILILD